MMISQVNEIYGAVTGKAHACKDNALKSISESFSELLVGLVPHEADTKCSKEITQIISFPKIEIDQTSNEDHSGNNSLVSVVCISSVIHPCNLAGQIVHDTNSGNFTGDVVYDMNSGNLAGHLVQIMNSDNLAGQIVHDINSGNFTGDVVHDMNSGNPAGHLVQIMNSDNQAGQIVHDTNSDKLTGQILQNMNSAKNSGVEGSDFHEAYTDGHYVQIHASSETLNIVPIETDSKGDLQKQLLERSDDFAKLRYAKSTIYNYVNKSDLSRMSRQGELITQAAEHAEIANFSDETKNYYEVQHSVRPILTEKYKELSARVTGYPLAYEAGGALILGEAKQITEGNSDRPIDNLKEFSILSEDMLEPNFTKNQRSSLRDSSLNGSEAERFWERNGSSELDSSFKTALYQAAYPLESFSQTSEVKDMITTKEDLLTLVAERMSVMSGEGITELEIKVHPESLGKLLLKVVNENGLYSAQITAETFQTKELLQSHLNDLKASLKEQGFDFIRLDVGLSNSQSNNRQWAWQDRFVYGRNNYGSIASGLGVQAVERVERTYNRIKASGHIDCLV